MRSKFSQLSFCSMSFAISLLSVSFVENFLLVFFFSFIFRYTTKSDCLFRLWCFLLFFVCVFNDNIKVGRLHVKKIKQKIFAWILKSIKVVSSISFSFAECACMFRFVSCRLPFPETSDMKKAKDIFITFSSRLIAENISLIDQKVMWKCINIFRIWSNCDAMSGSDESSRRIEKFHAPLSLIHSKIFNVKHCSLFLIFTLRPTNRKSYSKEEYHSIKLTTLGF